MCLLRRALKLRQPLPSRSLHKPTAHWSSTEATRFMTCTMLRADVASPVLHSRLHAWQCTACTSCALKDKTSRLYSDNTLSGTSCARTRGYMPTGVYPLFYGAGSPVPLPQIPRLSSSLHAKNCRLILPKVSFWFPLGIP